MNILPCRIHHLLKIYRDVPGGKGERAAAAPRPAARTGADRVEISEQGRKQEIERAILDQVLAKIR